MRPSIPPSKGNLKSTPGKESPSVCRVRTTHRLRPPGEARGARRSACQTNPISRSAPERKGASCKTNPIGPAPRPEGENRQSCRRHWLRFLRPMLRVSNSNSFLLQWLRSFRPEANWVRFTRFIPAAVPWTAVPARCWVRSAYGGESDPERGWRVRLRGSAPETPACLALGPIAWKERWMDSSSGHHLALPSCCRRRSAECQGAGD